jgi:hypothetical protein
MSGEEVEEIPRVFRDHQNVSRSAENYALATSDAEEIVADDSHEPVQQRPKRHRYFFFANRSTGESDLGQHHSPVDGSPTAKQVLAEAIDVNQETLHSIDRTERAMIEAEAIAGESRQQLQKDNENIEVIGRNLDEFEPLTKRAKRDLVIIVRRLARDKCFMVVLVIALGMVIAVIVVSKVTNRVQIPVLTVAANSTSS